MYLQISCFFLFGRSWTFATALSGERLLQYVAQAIPAERIHWDFAYLNLEEFV
ncbi:hypothetical protein VU04_07025 [Desulfobulbus sp. TB]|nr:hypothetical protein [Desulfobulbus sp. TB]